jgi:prepilin-type N-terminal cleavage/methylation domain-containing protein
MQKDGFTLIEMMFVVAVLGVLAAVAVVAYTKNVRKARAAEVPQVFGELRAKEEQYAAENGRYLPVCPNPSGTPVGVSDCAEGDWFPATLPGKGAVINYGALPARWLDLKVNMTRQGLYCQYEVIAGLANDRTQMGAFGNDVWGANTPTRNWFYLMSQCDWDGDSLVKAQYWQRDDWSEVGARNEGR